MSCIRAFNRLVTRESACHIPQKNLFCHIMGRLKTEAAALGARRTRAHPQAAGTQPDAANALGPKRAAANRAGVSKAILRRDHGTLQAQAGTPGDTNVSTGKEAKAEQKTMKVLAKTMRDGQTGTGRSKGRPKRGRTAECTAVEQGTAEAAGGDVKVKSEDLAVEGEPTQATASQGPTSRRKARPAVKLEEGTEPVSAPQEKRRKIAYKAQVQEGEAASGERAAAKPKKAAQRKARAGQAVKTEVPDASAQQQEAAPQKKTPAKQKVGRQPKVRAGQAAKAVLPDVSEQHIEAATEDAPAAKTKKGRQRKARAGLAVKAEMPDISCEQSVRSKAAAAPSRRKKRVDAGGDTEDILDGEIAIAELEEADIEEEIELVEITSIVPPGKLVGAHVSMSNGIARAVINAASIGAKAFALDTRSKRQWRNPPLTNANAAAFRLACNQFGFSPRQILPHGSYLINLGSYDPELLEKSNAALVEELQRCEKLGIELYNIHPGHHNKKIRHFPPGLALPGMSRQICHYALKAMLLPEECMLKVADSINHAHKQTTGVCVVLENVAGGGSSVGHSFEQLRFMVDAVHDRSRIGVCLDTCHMFAAGYDISTRDGYNAVMAQFGGIVGWQYLKGMHINDSKAALGSKRDRHENIGRGLIGINLFECLMNDPRLDGIPLIMETPSQEPGPKLNYPKSLLAGELIYRQDVNEVSESTDCRDVRFLYSLINS